LDKEIGKRVPGYAPIKVVHILFSFFCKKYIIDAKNSGTGLAHEQFPCGARRERTRRQARREGKGTNFV
jgi:hypothetical protein